MTKDGVYLLVGGPKTNRVTGPVGNMLKTLLRFRFASQTARSFIADQRKDDVAILADLMASGDLRTVIDTVYPLDDIAAAMDQLAAGHVSGKVVIKP
jgi:NADPH:quinone reductase-like Zn-dependent oxidoreductase